MFLNEANSFFTKNENATLFEKTIHFKNGADLFLHLSLQKIEFNEILFLFKCKDITEIIQFKDDIASKNTQLTAVSHILQHDLQSVADDLEFVLDFLTEYEYKCLNNFKNKYNIDIVTVFQQAVERNKIITKSLKEWLSFINSGYLFKDFVEIKPIIESVTQNNSGKSVEFNISDTFPKLLINEYQFKTLIDNLIKNGIKYNNKKHKKIAIYFDKPKNAIIIEDNGIGFPCDQFERLLKPFERSSIEYAGIGLGLTICSEIISNHKWQMQIESKENIYSKIYIILNNNI